MEKATYLSSIISALNKLNGMGSLNEIYDVIEKEGRLSYIFSNPNWKDNVRATIQRHCIQTKSYRGSEDLFRSVYGLGEGYWKFKNFDSSEYDNPIIDRQLKIIPLQTSELKKIVSNRKTYKELYPLFETAFNSNLPPHKLYEQNITETI